MELQHMPVRKNHEGGEMVMLAQALVDDPAKELSGDDKWYLWATVAEGRVEFTLQQIAAIGKIKTGVDRDRVYTPDALQQLARALVDDPGKELSWEDKWYLWVAVAKGRVVFTVQQIAAIGKIAVDADRCPNP
jgi:hypothetical protein